MEHPVLTEDHGGWRELTLNRPEKLNSFNDAQHVALRAALAAAAADDACRAILLTGAGRGFCAGQDLGDRMQAEGAEPPDLGATIEKSYNPLIRALRACPKPIVCAVNGVAAGAGANIALNCDIVLAAETARFIQAFAKIGLIPDAGGTWVLPRLVGEARAKALVMTATPVTAREAEAMGMIWKAVADQDLMTEARAMTASLAAAPTLGLGLAKKALHASYSNTLDAQLDLERDLQRQAGRTPDYAEGTRAFMEKRIPRFTGRM